MKKIFVVFVMNEDGKRWAIADSIRVGVNLNAHIKRHDAEICHLCETATQAHQLADQWNQSFIRNGTYFFD